MRRKGTGRLLAVLPFGLGLVACAPMDGPSVPAPVAGEGSCRDEGLDRFVGQTVTAALGAEMLKTSGARTLRWGAPGSAMTMDFRPDRLTVRYDEAMKVTSARCG